MAEIRFSNAAETDLTAIDDFSVLQFGEETGEQYMRGFTAAFARLGRFPMAGQETPQYGRGIRCLMQARHRILYRLQDDQVFVLRILHHARNAAKHLDT